jgi:hypothetical protein
MKSLFEEIAGHFRHDHHDLSDEVVQGFLRVLEKVRLETMPCSEVFAELDEYVEKEVRGEGAARLMPLLREHLDLCPDCCEEYEALLRVLEESPGPGTAAGKA